MDSIIINGDSDSMAISKIPGMAPAGVISGSPQCLIVGVKFSQPGMFNCRFMANGELLPQGNTMIAVTSADQMSAASKETQTYVKANLLSSWKDPTGQKRIEPLPVYLYVTPAQVIGKYPTL